MRFSCLYQFDTAWRSVFVTIALCWISVGTAEECKKSSGSYCKCTAGDFTVDLAPLVKGLADETPLFNDIAAPDGYLYSYRPCTAFNEKSEKTTPKHCQGVAACQYKKDASAFYSLGGQHSVNTSGDPRRGDVLFRYKANPDDAGKTRVAEVYLNCSNKKDHELIAKGQVSEKNNTITYRFELHTSVVCTSKDKKLSTGSVLLIVLFVSVLIYLVGGMLFLRFARGAKGWEQVPNYEFWHEFPLYVRDGVVFTINGCKTETTYEKI